MSPRSFHRLATLIALLFGLAAQAHHSDDTKSSGTPIELQGKITFVSWDGAHVMYRIDAENAQHEVQHWEVMGASPKILRIRKIAKDTFQIGEHVTVNGYLNPHNKIISVASFTKADGQKYSMGFFPGNQPAAQTR